MYICKFEILLLVDFFKFAGCKIDCQTTKYLHVCYIRKCQNTIIFASQLIQEPLVLNFRLLYLVKTFYFTDSAIQHLLRNILTYVHNYMCACGEPISCFIHLISITTSPTLLLKGRMMAYVYLPFLLSYLSLEVYIVGREASLQCSYLT